MKKFTILGISGSLRENSINSDLLNRISASFSEEITFNLLDRHHLELPLFNQDIAIDQASRDKVIETKKNISDVDAVLFASPEYNGSMTGAIKNFIDWLSIDLGGGLEKNVFAKKIISVVSVSPSNFGGIKGMIDLRDPGILCLSKITDYSEKQMQLIKDFSHSFIDFIKK